MDISDIFGVENYQPNNKNKMTNLLNFLDGKKTVIQGLITLTASFLVDMGKIDAKTGIYIGAVALLVFGSASIQTANLRASGQL